MTAARKAILVAGFCAVYGVELFFTIRLSTPDGIRLNHPIAGSEVPRASVATGDAWMKQGIARIEVLVTGMAAGTTTVVPAARDAVKYRGKLTWKSWIRIAVVTNVATLAAWGFNQLLRFIPPYDIGNYFVIGYPPPNGSIIDVFSEIFGLSPRCLVALELVGAVLLGFMYLPCPIRRLIRRRSRAGSSPQAPA